jgi:DNA integrity scanning protein DisA with diadenylate cyclase activity
MQIGPFMANSRIIHAASEIGNELMLNIPLSKTFPAIDGVLVVPTDRLVISHI